MAESEGHFANPYKRAVIWRLCQSVPDFQYTRAGVSWYTLGMDIYEIHAEVEYDSAILFGYKISTSELLSIESYSRWCKAEDVEALIAQNQELKDELARLKDS